MSSKRISDFFTPLKQKKNKESTSPQSKNVILNNNPQNPQTRPTTPNLEKITISNSSPYKDALLGYINSRSNSPINLSNPPQPSDNLSEEPQNTLSNGSNEPPNTLSNHSNEPQNTLSNGSNEPPNTLSNSSNEPPIILSDETNLLPVSIDRITDILRRIKIERVDIKSQNGADYKFIMYGNKKRTFQYSWYSRKDHGKFLLYWRDPISEADSYLVCYVCMMFKKNADVDPPKLENYKNISQTLQCHADSNGHKECVAMMEARFNKIWPISFNSKNEQIYTVPSLAYNQLKSTLQSSSIVTSPVAQKRLSHVSFCVRLITLFYSSGIPMRGDQENLEVLRYWIENTEVKSTGAEKVIKKHPDLFLSFGNFLIFYENLTKHFEMTDPCLSHSYTSHRVMVEVGLLARGLIRSEIFDKIGNDQPFSIALDGSGKLYVLIIRFKYNDKIVEQVLDCKLLKDGKSLTMFTFIKESLNDLGLKFTNFISLAGDHTNSNSGEIKGLKGLLSREKSPVTFLSDTNHRLATKTEFIFESLESLKTNAADLRNCITWNKNLWSDSLKEYNLVVDINFEFEKSTETCSGSVTLTDARPKHQIAKSMIDQASTTRWTKFSHILEQLCKFYHAILKFLEKLRVSDSKKALSADGLLAYFQSSSTQNLISFALPILKLLEASHSVLQTRGRTVADSVKALKTLSDRLRLLDVGIIKKELRVDLYNLALCFKELVPKGF